MFFILDGFNCWKLAFLDPTHKFPWAAFFISNFLNFVVKEEAFCSLNYAFEVAPVFNTPRMSIPIK